MKKTIEVLLVANSFGINLHEYVHQLSEDYDALIDIYVLHYPGCCFEQHHDFISNKKPAYVLYHNGKEEKRDVTAQEIIRMRKWDYVSIHQASYAAGKDETYEPHIGYVYNFVKENAPEAEIIYQSIWRCAPTCTYDSFKAYGSNAEVMYCGINECTAKYTKKYNIQKVVRSGELVEAYIAKYGEVAHSDGLHLNQAGCYLIGLGLLRVLGLKKINDHIFLPGPTYCQDGYTLDETRAKEIIQLVDDFFNK